MAGEKILIVEDQVYPAGRRLERVLKKEGYRVLDIAETVDDAVELALRERPPVVLMDIQLGDDSDRLAGTQAAVEIQDKTGAYIVFVTGVKSDPELLQAVNKTRAYQFLRKPVDEKQLLDSVQLGIMMSQGKGVVFVSYSRLDKKFAEELQKQVSTLADMGVDLWMDTRIRAGDKWRPEITRALSRATAAVCLISVNFVNSRFIKEVELPEIMKAADERRLKVIPVFVGLVDREVLQRIGFADIQGINGPDDPINGWGQNRRDRDCWIPLCKELRQELVARA
jgi:response regulator RpfG family c-di-GMP phosphodiesterase